VLRGFSIIAKVREGREETVRAYGKTIEETIASSPEVLAPLRLHYLRWVRDSCAFERGIGRWNRHSPTRFRIGSVPSQPSASPPDHTTGHPASVTDATVESKSVAQ
jgi:hypothetical protein